MPHLNCDVHMYAMITQGLIPALPLQKCTNEFSERGFNPIGRAQFVGLIDGRVNVGIDAGVPGGRRRPLAGFLTCPSTDCLVWCDGT